MRLTAACFFSFAMVLPFLYRGKLAMTFGIASRFRLALLVVILTILLGPSAIAGTIRHDDLDGDPSNDPDDYLYLNLGQQYPSVGRFDLAFSFPEGPKLFRGSGTLISDGWVLTAAHLFKSTDKGYDLPNLYPYPDSRFTFANSDDLLGERYGIGGGIDGVILADGWTGDNLFDGHDLALVRLDHIVTDVTPAELYSNSDELGRVGTVAGYGTMGTGNSGYVSGTSGTKRAGNNVIDSLGSSYDGDWSSNLLLTDFDDPPGGLWWYNPLGDSEPLDREYFATPVDSGGGLFVDVSGTRYLAGVFSFLYEPLLAGFDEADGSYGEVNGFTRVSAFADWINSTIQSSSDTMTWTSAQNGSFNSGAKWSGLVYDATVPGRYDTAVLSNAAGTPVITLPADFTNMTALGISDKF